MNPIFSFTCAGLVGTRLIGFRGTEGVSRPYQLTVSLEVLDGAEVADSIGVAASLHVDAAEGPYSMHGVVAATELLEETSGGALVNLIIVPRLWRLSLSRHSRAFTDKSVPEIIRSVLDLNHMNAHDFEMHLSGDYSARDYVAQFNESDFDFISRLMEQAGIHYYFEHGESREKVIITDRLKHDTLRQTPVRYYPVAGNNVASTDSFAVFRARTRALPNQVRVHGYSYEHPTLAVGGKAAVANGEDDIEVVYHGNLAAPKAAQRGADERAQELTADKSVFHAKGAVFGLRSGYVFALEEHPRASMNTDYMALVVNHRGLQSGTSKERQEIVGLGGPDDVYLVEVEASLAGLQYRPREATSKPRAHGHLRAVIDGDAESDYAQIDKHGRYKVRFMFDEQPRDDGHASAWVRMAQPHGGAREGFHFPLRKGTEVLVTCVDGDPDYPVIAAMVPNTLTRSPVDAGNHTQNVLLTGGGTRLMIEDQEGSQHVDWWVPEGRTEFHLGKPHPIDGTSRAHTHYVTLKTEGTAFFGFGSDHDIDVGGHLHEHVAGDVVENYDATRTTQVYGAVAVLHHATQLTVVDGAVTDVHQAGRTSTVNGGVHETWVGPHTHSVTGNSELTRTGTVYSEITGQVQSLCPTGVDIDWGPMRAKMASVNWNIPGGVDIFTPRWEVHTPEHSWLAATAKHIFGDETEVRTHKVEMNGVVFEIVGLAIELHTGAHIENAPMHVEVVGLHMSREGMALEHHAINIKKDGVSLWKAGVMLGTSGLWCFK